MGDLVACVVGDGRSFVDLLTWTWASGDALLPVDPRLPPAAREVLLDSMGPRWFIDADGRRHRRRDAAPVADGDALVVATSGSTGAPKGVVHTHGSVAASAAATNAGLGLDVAHDRFLCCLPLHHVAGLSVVTRALAAGVEVEVLDRFDARAVEDAARYRGATITTVVPTALARIDPTLYRRIVVGGAAPPDDLPPNVVVSYGLTETGSAVTYDGRPLQGAEIQVTEGRIAVRGPMLLRAYRDGTDPRDPDGWLRTGDRGEIDEAGVLVVHGRGDDLIITGGENVWPAPVEAVLRRHPAVADVAVIGRADARWGQAVTVVVAHPDQAPPTLDDLRSLAKAHLAPHAAPQRLEVVDALPRTSLGKLRRREV